VFVDLKQSADVNGATVEGKGADCARRNSISATDKDDILVKRCLDKILMELQYIMIASLECAE
jgi:hypothetical protein